MIWPVSGTVLMNYSMDKTVYFATLDQYKYNPVSYTHLEDDAKVGRKYDMPFVQLVDEKGEMGKTTPFAGLFVKKADLSLIHIYLLC